MSINLKKSLSFSSALLVTLIVQPSHAQNALDEIVVTARKRSESAQSVPIAIQAFSAAEIERAGIKRPDDYIGLTPGVTIINSVNVGEGHVNIRGIHGPFDTEQPFALVIDGVLSANPNALNEQMLDVKQIEVIKGPQGALYGRNAIGGAINITTPKPDENVEGKVLLGFGNGNSVEAGGVISGPVVADRVFARVSVSHTDRDGYYQNTYLNTRVDPYRENSIQGRVIVRLNDVAELDLKSRASEIKAGAGFFNVQAFNVDTNDTSQGWQSNILGLNKQKRFDASAKLDYRAAFATVTGIVSYAKLDEFFFADGPFNAAAFTNPNYFNLVPTPYWGFSYLNGDGNQLTTRNQKDLSFELRLTSPSEQRLRWIAGAYYADIKRDAAQDTRLDNGPGIVIPHVLITDPFGPNPTNNLLWADNKNKALALFGQIEFDLTHDLELSLAARWDEERRKNINLVPDITSPGSIFLGAPRPLTNSPGLVREAKFSKTQPRVTLRYKATEHVNFYASYGEGFRSGGFNAAGSGALVRAVDNPNSPLQDDFAAETSKAYEIGFKTQGFGNRVTFNGAAYWTNVANAHDFKFFPVSLTRAIAIIDKVRNRGFELELRYQPLDDWSMFADYGYVDARIRKNSEDPNGAGKIAPETPKYNLAIGTEYSHHLTEKLDAQLRIDYQRLGRTWFDSLNTPGTDRDPVNLVNLRIGLKQDGWLVEAWSKNLFDKQYAAGTTVVSFLNYPFRAPPRTFGLTATYKF